MTRRDLIGAALLQSTGRPFLLDEDFRCAAAFDLRETVPSTPERTGNWAVKIAQLRDGRLVMVWCSTSGAEVSRTNRIWISRSSNEGDTWSEPRAIVSSTSGESVLNPAIHVGDDGALLLFHNAGDAKERFDLLLRRSRDGGETWDAPVALPFGETVVSSAMSNPVRTRDGALVLPVCYSRPKHRNNHYLSTAMISRDGGESWKKGGDIHVEVQRGAMEPTVAELSNGDLHCLMRTKAGFHYESRSRDGGMTWSAARPSPFAGPESTGILLRLADGALLFAWNGNGLSGGKQVPRYPMTVAMSADDGKTWPWRRVVETTSGDRQLSNHSLFQTRSGKILLPMNHFQGIREGREYGPIVQARFDEAWLRCALSPERWEESAAPAGAIRMGPEGVTLISGAAAEETTILASRVALPAAGAIEVDVAGLEGTLGDGAGVYFGGSPFNGPFAGLRPGRQKIAMRRAGAWGFYARNDGAQVRVTIRGVRIAG